MYALLSLIQAMLNMSTLSTNDQGKLFWELVYGSVNHISFGWSSSSSLVWRSPFPVILQRIFNTCLKKFRLLFSAVISEHFSKTAWLCLQWLQNCGISKMCGFYWATLYIRSPVTLVVISRKLESDFMKCGTFRICANNFTIYFSKVIVKVQGQNRPTEKLPLDSSTTD